MIKINDIWEYKKGYEQTHVNCNTTLKINHSLFINIFFYNDTKYE